MMHRRAGSTLYSTVSTLDVLSVRLKVPGSLAPGPPGADCHRAAPFIAGPRRALLRAT